MFPHSNVGRPAYKGKRRMSNIYAFLFILLHLSNETFSAEQNNSISVKKQEAEQLKADSDYLLNQDSRICNFCSVYSDFESCTLLWAEQVTRMAMATC